MLSSPNRPTQKHRGVPWASPPLCFFPGLLDAVMCCRVFLEKNVLFGSSVALQEIGLLANMFLGGGSLFLSLPLSSCPVRLNQAQVSTQDTVGFFSLSECLSSSFCVWVPLFLSNLAALCLGRLKSALRFCSRRVAPGFFCSRAPPLCGPFLGFGIRLAGGLAVFLSLSLSLFLSVSCCSFCFSLLFGAATLFLNAPSPSGSTVGL